MNTRVRRLARLEAARKPPRPAFNSRVEVGVFETREQAVDRHRAAHGRPPRGIALFIVPAKPANEAERVECLRRFKQQQEQLRSAARSERIAAHPTEPLQTLPVGMVAHPFPPAIPPQWRIN